MFEHELHSYLGRELVRWEWGTVGEIRGGKQRY